MTSEVQEKRHSEGLGRQERDHERRFCIRSLLCLLTTHDTAGSRQISSAKIKEHREMSRLVARSQAKQRVVKLVAAM